MSSRASFVAGALAVLFQGCAAPPSAAAAGRIAGWRWVPAACIEARLAKSADGVQVAFAKSGEERRFLALERETDGVAADAKALSVRYLLRLTRGNAPRLGLLVFERDGGAWFKVGAMPLAVGEAAEARLPLRSLRKAEFSLGGGEEVRWPQVAKLWLGLLLDGPAEGTLELGEVHFTAEPYRPPGPLRVPVEGVGLWSVGKDPAVQAELTLPPDGPDGKPCMKFVFAFPGGRHMYALPTLALPEIELDGYRVLRFTYKVTLPKGIDGLLVSLQERGHAQYYADPGPPASEEWRAATIPFDALKLGAWSKDENGRLDLGEVASVTIGLHGTAAEPKAGGIILVSEVEFVP